MTIITKELANKIMKLNNEGFSTGEIARQLNIAEYKVVMVLHDYIYYGEH